MLTKRRRGSKGEPSPGVPPLRAAPPPAAYARRRGAGGGRTFGSSRTPTPTAGGRRPVCHVIYRESIPRPGGNVVRPAWTVRAGRRGRRPLQGWCGDVVSEVIAGKGRRGRRPLQGGCGSMGPAVCRRRTQSRFQSKNAPGGAFSAYFSVFSAFSSGSGGAQKRPYIVAYLRILAASSGLASPGFMRQRQLPWAVPGTFMRASAPRPR